MFTFDRSLALAVTALIAYPVVAEGQQRDSTTTTIAPVVVTATRNPTPITRATQPVTVLSGAELRTRGVTTVADALREVPGAQLARSGSFGGVTSLFLRGGESRYTKVLVDGVPVNTVGGVVFLENFSLENVDRIEVVEGPASALYGADAMAGVVQIFTRRGSAHGADLAVARGSYGTRQLTASLRGGNDIADVSVGVGSFRTRGVAAFNNAYANDEASAALDARPDALTALKLTSRYTAATYHFPTDYAGNATDTNSYSRQHRLVLGAELSRRLGAVTARLLGGDMEVHDLSEDTQRSGTEQPATLTKVSQPSDGARRDVEVRLEGSVPRFGVVTAGAQYEDERERTLERTRTYITTPDAVTPVTLPGSDAHRFTRGLYAAVQGTLLPLVGYDASARYDDHSDYKAVSTYHAGMSVALWPGARARAAYGTGFNAPAFYETQGTVYNRPNPKLQPEQTRSYDVGLEQIAFAGRVRASVGSFDQRFSQLIQFVGINGSLNGAPASYYANLTAATARGFQGELRALPIPELGIFANYTQTIARVSVVPPDYAGSLRPGDALLRRPSHSGSAGATYADAGWSVGAVATYVGARPDLDFTRYPTPTVTLPPYTRLDLSANIPVERGEPGASVAALTVRVENALGRHYQEIFNFAAPGRTVLVGARVSTAP